jgi:hypothetical protein
MQPEKWAVVSYPALSPLSASMKPTTPLSAPRSASHSPPSSPPPRVQDRAEEQAQREQILDDLMPGWRDL